MENQNNIVKICSALSNKPIFVKITDPSVSIDRIFNEAIMTLRNSGRPLEGESLEQLYKSHQLFNNGKVVQKGDLFSEIPKVKQTIGDKTLNLLEIDLVTSHSGGSVGGIEVFTKEYQKFILEKVKEKVEYSITSLPVIHSYSFFSDSDGSFSVKVVLENCSIRDQRHEDLLNKDLIGISRHNNSTEMYMVRLEVNGKYCKYKDVLVEFI